MGRAATLAAVAMLALPAGAQEDGCGGDPCCECFAECPRDGTDEDIACQGQCEGGACMPTVDRMTIICPEQTDSCDGDGTGACMEEEVGAMLEGWSAGPPRMGVCRQKPS